VGSYTQPVIGNSGRYYVLYVLAHEEHELESQMLSYEQDRLFNDWFTQQRQSVEYSDNWQDKVPGQ
jgi:hypothetical protein